MKQIENMSYRTHLEKKKVIPYAGALPLLDMPADPGGAGELEEFEDGESPMLAQSAPIEP